MKRFIVSRIISMSVIVDAPDEESAEDFVTDNIDEAENLAKWNEEWVVEDETDRMRGYEPDFIVGEEVA